MVDGPEEDAREEGGRDIDCEDEEESSPHSVEVEEIEGVEVPDEERQYVMGDAAIEASTVSYD